MTPDDEGEVRARSEVHGHSFEFQRGHLLLMCLGTHAPTSQPRFPQEGATPSAEVGIVQTQSRRRLCPA